ncbi:hypothetical protein ACFVQ4_11525 [Streptomyces laurentii]|uniref:hypothetical protein n=1 Tax=Streptomyces laurentii TaxID=39478 RepID=UPI0036D140AE
MDHWAVLKDAERDQWGYSPHRTIGPLDFGTGRAEAIAVMAEHGFLAEQESLGRWQLTDRTQWRVRFRKPGRHRSDPAVTCYFIDGAGLTCVLVDGRSGPQVTHEGIRLIGRVPSELEQEMVSYAMEHDAGLRCGPGGDLSAATFEIDLSTQRAGDRLVTWALFCRPGELAGTSFDIAPAEVWRHR